MAHRGRGEATGQHHHSSGEARPSLLCDAEIERHTGTTERMGNLGLDEYRIGIESRVAEAVEIGGCGDPHHTPYQETPAAKCLAGACGIWPVELGTAQTGFIADSQNFFDALITEDTENGDGSAGGYDPGGRCYCHTPWTFSKNDAQVGGSGLCGGLRVLRDGQPTDFSLDGHAVGPRLVPQGRSRDRLRPRGPSP